MSYDASEYDYIIVYDDDRQTNLLPENALGNLVNELKLKDVNVIILQDGYADFNAKYPFLGISQTVLSSKERQKLLVSYPSAILDNLFLGRGDQATNPVVVSNLALTHILNISTEHDNAFPDRVEYYHVKEEDETDTDLYPEFHKMISFIDKALKFGGRILVHCNLGASRSATTLIAYFMYTRKWTLETAHSFVRHRRPLIDPNPGFLKQLSKFEVNIFGKMYTDLDCL